MTSMHTIANKLFQSQKESVHEIYCGRSIPAKRKTEKLEDKHEIW